MELLNIEFLRHWIFLCEIWNTNLWLLWVNCDFIYEKFLYLLLSISSVADNSIMVIIIYIILLWLYIYIPYKYMTNKKVTYFFVILFLISLYFLNIKYLLFVLILDTILYFLWYIFRKNNNLTKLSNKQLSYYFMYGKFIPILGYFYSLRIWLTNKLTAKQLFWWLIVSNINLLIWFMFILGFLVQLNWFYRVEFLNDELWWQNEKLLYTEIWAFLIVYIIWISLYFLRYRKI